MGRSRRLHAVLAVAVAGVVLGSGAVAAPAHAIDVAVVADRLVLSAGPGETNRVSVTPAGAEILVADPGGGVLPVSAGCRALPDVAHTVACDAAPVASVLVDVGDLDDRVDVGVALPTTLRGGPGDDVLIGGEGPDTLVGGLGSDAIVGAGGVDTVRYDDGLHESGVGVSLGGGANDGSLGENDDVQLVEGIVGTAGDDRVLGSDAAESFVGGPGNDTAQLGAGDDAFAGGPGDDRCVQPTAGNDVCDGGPGTDLVFYLGTLAVRVSLDGVADDGPRGATGNVADVEEVIGGEGSDVIVGGPGPETLSGRGGDDVIHGGGGDDLLAGDRGADVLRGGPGRDRVTYASVLVAGPVRVAIDGRARDGVAGEDDSVAKDVEEVDGTLTGADVLVGGRDRGPAGLNGLGGQDVLVGSRSAGDVLDAGEGSDRIAVLDGRRDTVRCGPGRDEVIADAVDVVEGCESRVVVRPTVPARPRAARVVDLTLRCPRHMRLAGSAARVACRGTVSLESASSRGRAERGRRARLARARFVVPAGRRRPIVLRLPPAGFARVRGGASVRVVTRLNGVPGIVHAVTVRLRPAA